MKKKIILIDGSSYIYRAFYALPLLTSPKGEPTGAIYGFYRMISKLIFSLNPEYIAVVFDLPGQTTRHKEFKEYKATRKETPNDLVVQIPKIKKLLQLLGISIIEKQGFEADDIIATLAKKAEKEGFEVIVVSPDKDMIQLIDENIKLLNPISETFLDREKVKEKYGIYPEQFEDYLAMIGDNVDNIPGIKGVGAKTAAKLLNEFGSLDNILQNKDKLSGKLKEIFYNLDEESIKMSRYLVKLQTDIDLDINIEDLKKKKTDFMGLKNFLEELGFKTVLKDLDKFAKDDTPKQGSLF